MLKKMAFKNDRFGAQPDPRQNLSRKNNCIRKASNTYRFQNILEKCPTHCFHRALKSKSLLSQLSGTL